MLLSNLVSLVRIYSVQDACILYLMLTCAIKTELNSLFILFINKNRHPCSLSLIIFLQAFLYPDQVTHQHCLVNEMSGRKQGPHISTLSYKYSLLVVFIEFLCCPSPLKGDF